jgi:hypothetical protein
VDPNEDIDTTVWMEVFYVDRSPCEKASHGSKHFTSCGTPVKVIDLARNRFACDDTSRIEIGRYDEPHHAAKRF